MDILMIMIVISIELLMEPADCPGVVAQIIEKNGTDNIDIVSRATCSQNRLLKHVLRL